MAKTDTTIRREVLELLRGGSAHTTFDHAIDGLRPELRGRKPVGQPHTVWRQLEHMRLAQRDILDFIRSEDYRERAWPDDYWPDGDAPPSDAAWDEAVEAFREDAATLERLVHSLDDLTGRVPAGDGQTYLREFLLVADHNAYHIGQVVLLRRLLGDWSD